MPHRMETKWALKVWIPFSALLGDVTYVVVWEHKLVSHLILLYNCFEIIGTLVVQDVVFWADATCFQSVDEGLVGTYHLAGCPIFHRSYQNCSTVDVGQYHDVLVLSA